MFDPEIATMPTSAGAQSQNAPTGAGARGMDYEAGRAARSVVSGQGPPLAARFSGDATLERLYREGGFIIGRSHNGATVQAIQQALLDLGYSLPRFGADGSWGGESRAAVRALQGNAGITVDGKFGQQTLRVLSQRAPAAAGAPGRHFDWSRLLADEKLEIVAGFGYDEGQSHFTGIAETVAWLLAEGFRLTGSR